MTKVQAKDAQPDLLGGSPHVLKPKKSDPAKPAAAKTKTAAKPMVVPQPAVKKGSLTVVRNTPANTLAVIAEALKDPSFKPKNMKLVLDMHRETVAEQARLDFINAFHAMKKELPRINKDGRIEILEKGSDGKRQAGRDKIQQSTPYATYENIREAVDPILDRHNFTMWDESEPSADGARILVKTHLDHNNGHGRVSIFPLPAETSGSKNNVQGWGSSFSYGKRYGCIGLLNIRTKAPEDRDTDGVKPRAGDVQVIEGDVVKDAITTEQHDRLVDAIEACGVGRAKFCTHYAIEKVASLPASLFDEAMLACKNFTRKKAG